MAPLNDTVQEEEADHVQVEEMDQAEDDNEEQLTPEQVKQLIPELISEGKRQLASGEFEKAANDLGKAAEYSVDVFGTFAPEVFEPHFLYGRAMVEMASVEADVFQSAMSDMPKKIMEVMKSIGAGDEEKQDQSMTEEEADEVREMVAEALAEGAEEEEKAAENEEEEAEGEAENGGDEEGAAQNAPDAEKIEDEGVEINGEDAEEKEGDDEEIGDEEEEMTTAQLAWEALEVAAKVASQQPDTEEWKKKRADVLVQLSQCSTIDENYEQALEDLEKARTILTSFTTEADRLMIEVFFHMGRVHRLGLSFEKAQESFEKAVECCVKCIDAVKTAAEGGELSEEARENIEELEGVMSDIKKRAEDSKESAKQKEQVEALKAEEKKETPAVLTSSTANTDTTANDITGLVRKKRGLQEEEVEGGEVKKAKSECTEEEKGDENIAV